MVQNVSTPNNSGTYGGINKLGMNNNGRVVYQVIDSTGQVAGKMSVAPKDCDKFERSYDSIVKSAPKLQAYAQKTSPEKMEKKQKLAKWIVGGTTAIGLLIPMLKCKPNGTFWGWIKAIGLTALSGGAGAVGGVFIASKMVTPPGATEFAKATQTISKLDIKPEE